MQLVTEIEIAASAQEVWAVVAELDTYPQWNPLILEVRGALVPGGRLWMREHVYRRVVIRVGVDVTDVDAPRRLAWRGGLRPAALFAVQREIRLEPLAVDRVRFLNVGSFSGMLLPVFSGGLTTHLKPKLEAMNRALKARAESRVARRADVRLVPVRGGSAGDTGGADPGSRSSRARTSPSC